MILEELKKACPHIDRIDIEYNGYGDSMDDLSITAWNPDGINIPLPPDIYDTINTYCMSVFDTYEPGWWNDGGGEGSFSIDLKTGEISWTHANFYMERDETTRILGDDSESASTQ